MFFCFEGHTQNEEIVSVKEFIKGLSFKGPDVGGTFEEPDPASQWPGEIIYSSSTKYINWHFSFSYDGLKGIPIDFDVKITRNGELIFDIPSHFDFSIGEIDYFDGFEIENNADWPAGIYTIGWYSDDIKLTEVDFEIYEDDLNKSDLVSRAYIRDFEVYFKEHKEAYRDYTFHNNYHFPQERVGLIAWRITFNLPYSINRFELKTEIRISTQSGEIVDTAIGKTESKDYPGFNGQLEWLAGENWPKGSYNMDILLEDRNIVSREFYIE